jgi:nucleoid DNA-binding protein
MFLTKSSLPSCLYSLTKRKLTVYTFINFFQTYIMKKTKGKNAVMIELHDWAVSKRKDDRIGRVVKSKTIDVDDLVNMVVNRRTDLNATTVKAAFELMKEMAIEQIANGASVDFGIGYFQLNVKGVFVGDNAKWDEEQNSLSLKTLPCQELKTAMQNCDITILGKANSSTMINTVTDLSTGLVNQCLTPGGPVNISGTHLKIAGDHSGVGLRLLNLQTNEEVEVPFYSILENVPKSIKFVVPVALEAGNYQVVIVSQATSNRTFLKEPRTYTFNQVLEVK